MPTTRRTRVIDADVDRVWGVASDVHAMPRWWPRVARVEAVTPEGFTQVLQTKTGKPVRADFRFKGQAEPYVRTWAQEVEGTPFERVLRAARVTLRVEADRSGGAKVTLVQVQKLRGFSRFGGFLVTRATRRILDDALEGLERTIV